MERLEVENKHLKLALNSLHKNIILGETMQQMQLGPPDGIRNTTILNELTEKAHGIHLRFIYLETEMERLEVENKHLKLFLDSLHSNIILGEAKQQIPLKSPDDRKNTKFLKEFTEKANHIHLRFFDLEKKLDHIQKTIAQLTSTITGENRREEYTQANTNKLTSTGRQPKRNPEKNIVQSEQSSKIYNDIELIRSALITLKKNERELAISKQELEKKITENEHRPQSSGPALLRRSMKGAEHISRGEAEHRSAKRAWGDNNVESERKETYMETHKTDRQRRLSTTEECTSAHTNVSIADLSDADRPTKLGLLYTDLYENKFTAAVEELTMHDTITETDAFMMLLNILMSSFQNCIAMTWGRYENLINIASSVDIEQESPLSYDKIVVKDNVESNHSIAIQDPMGNCERDDEEKHLKFTIDLNLDLKHDIMNIWRKATLELKEIAAERLYSVIETCLDMPFDVQPMTSNYIKRCIDLCWKMGVQEKPLHLDGFAEMKAYAGKKFDKEKFDAHIRCGSHIATVVLPTLYLYEGGPVLVKGIAQCSPDETESEESS